MLKNYFKIFENVGSTIKDLVTNATGAMSGMDPNTDWIAGNVDCGSNLCEVEMTQLVTITINPLPSINAVSTESLLCAGQTASLSASGAATYTWNPGGTGTSIAVSPTVTTTYSVSGTDANGCVNNAVFTQSVSTCTGISEITTGNNVISLFPNPVSGYLTVRTDEPIQFISIYTTVGKLIQTETQNIFSVEHLASGMYMIKIQTERGMSTIRFVKE